MATDANAATTYCVNILLTGSLLQWRINATPRARNGKAIDYFLFGRMTSPAFQPSSHPMRSFFDIAGLATARAPAGGVAASMTKTTKTA
jgi:hypothetical protein